MDHNSGQNALAYCLAYAALFALLFAASLRSHLRARTSSEGPGPLVATIGRTAGDYPIPVAIVPGHLTDEEIDALSG